MISVTLFFFIIPLFLFLHCLILSCRSDMKIFNWLHQKFHRNAHEYMVSPKKDKFAYDNIGKSETVSVTNEIDTNALLNQATLMDVWKDGILTIGTLGFEYIEDEQEVETQEEKVHSPPSVTKERQPVKPSPCFDNVACLSLDDTAVAAGAIKVEETPDITPLLEIVEMRKRVTLADLLSTDKEVNDNVCDSKLSGDINRSCIIETEKKGKNNKLPFRKKHKGEDSCPTGKLRRMMHKMIKKKIHPDLPGKDERKDTAEKAIDEMVSLIRGAV